MLRIYIAVGYRPNGTYKILVYPAAKTPGHRDVGVKRRKPVHWTVSNTTETALKVRVQNFRRPDGTSAQPIDWQNQEASVPAANNAGVPGRSMLKGTVKDNADALTYDYEVRVGTTVVTDPKLRVDNGDILPKPKKKTLRKK